MSRCSPSTNPSAPLPDNPNDPLGQSVSREAHQTRFSLPALVPFPLSAPTLRADLLAPFAAAGSAEFVALAIALAALVGVIQFSLGVLRMGALGSFISHPVVVGFTNAAAIIIGLSQLNKLLGLPLDTHGPFLLNIWNLLGQIAGAHLPTGLMGVGAIGLMVASSGCLRGCPECSSRWS